MNSYTIQSVGIFLEVVIEIISRYVLHIGVLNLEIGGGTFLSKMSCLM